MSFELSKNIELPKNQSGGDYTLLKKGEVKIGFTMAVDPAEKKISATPRVYRKDGSQVMDFPSAAVTINADSITVNNEVIVEKNAYDKYVAGLLPTLSAETLALLLTGKVGDTLLSDYIQVPVK